MPDLSVILLHDQMVDKRGDLVTTSITLLDIHDLARSSRTYGVQTCFVGHSSSTMRDIAATLRRHWDEGYGATYNPDRKEALGVIDIVSSLDEAMEKVKARTGSAPKLIATSAQTGSERVSFSEMRSELKKAEIPFLLMLGTGWGMSPELLARADYFLEPIQGAEEYNHLSVRSAGAIMLDRLLGER